jgi:hypothetical protein
MTIYAIFPDDAYMKSMSVHTMEKPSQALQKLGVICSSQGDFFEKFYSTVQRDDIVIVWIGTRNEVWLDLLSELKCRKFLRNIDSCKSDRILFKREQEIFGRVGFEAILVTYCTEFNKSFLSEKGINSIDYPHLIDFSNEFNVPTESKSYDVFISGQMSNHSYPTRTKLAEVLIANRSKYRTCQIQHPGHSKQHASHQYFGDKYIELASKAKLGVVCTGDDDSLVMKYLEFAKAGILPVGDYPSNMPSNAIKSMIVINRHDSDDVLIKQIDSILSDSSELDRRIAQYREAMKTFDISKTKDVLYKIQNSIYDGIRCAEY